MANPEQADLAACNRQLFAGLLPGCQPEEAKPEPKPVKAKPEPVKEAKP